MSRPLGSQRKSILKKSNADVTVNLAAEFQTRKNFAHHLTENFTNTNRRSYYQRLLILVKNTTSGGALSIKQEINQILSKCNDNLAKEQVTGLCIYYDNYCMFMLEGSEDVLGEFLQKFDKLTGDYFEFAKILVIVNNINKLFFKTFLWRTAIPPSLTEKFENDDEENIRLQHEVLNERLLMLCKVISDSLTEDNPRRTEGSILVDPEYLSTEYTKHLISIVRIEFVLRATYLFDVSEYAKMYKQIPIFEYIDEKVWPVPYDYTPFGVFATGKYEVNLTFKDAHKLL